MQIAQVQEKIELLKADLNSRTNAEVENRYVRELRSLFTSQLRTSHIYPVQVFAVRMAHSVQSSVG